MPGELAPSRPTHVKPLDLSHHLSAEARSRTANAMKAIWKMAQAHPHAVSLANGDPHFSLYPIHKMEFEIPSLDAEDPVHAWRFSENSSTTISASTDPSTSVVPLRRSLGYTTGAGLPETQDIFAELTRLFHAPPNHRVTPTLGNFDGVAKCFRLLGEAGDSFLADEFTFSALTTVATYHGVNWVPVHIDAGGLVPSELESLLANWNVAEQGRRPHVLYTTPSGQNPTGSTLSLERRRAIYDIARRWDLIIVEDDPYYFLQYDLPSVDTTAPDFVTKYAEGFTPSFLSMDVDGRVIRNDSFSKILAPGMRLGWVTASPFFTERLVYLTDASTMHPHGFGQNFMLELLGPRGWGTAGYARWAHSLCADYRRRRDAFLSIFAEHVPPALASAEVPQAGMFFWIKVAIERHPRYTVEEDGRTNEEGLMDELFQKLLADGVVMMPASIFAIVDKGKGKPASVAQHLNHFRATFAGTEEIVHKGLTVFGRSLVDFFAETQ